MNKSTQFLLILLVCFCTFFADLQAFYPDIMEMRNFITAREMLTDGNWWNTTMNYEPRLEKPPLPTWLTALSVKYLGSFENLFIARLPSAAIATLMVFFFYGFCRELSKEKYLPFVGALVMATSLMVLQQARVNSWDIYTHVFMLGSLWQFLVVVRTKQFKNVLLSILLFTLSIYSKGPVSLYALWLPFLLAFAIDGGFDFLKKYKTQFFTAFLVALLLGFSWNLYMALFQPEASDFVINKETNSWVNRHVQPFYFYFHFAVYIGIWVVFMVSSFFYKYSAARINRFGKYKFQILWVLLTVLFLSIIPTKKERYLVPALIPMCLIVTFQMYSIWQAFKGKYDNKWDRLVVNTSSILIYSVAILLPFIFFFILSERVDFRSSLFVLLIGILGITGFVFRKRWIESHFILPVVMVCLFCLGLLPQVAEFYYENDEFYELSQIQKVNRIQDLNFYWQSDDIDVKVMYGAGKQVLPFSQIDFDNKELYPFVFICYVSLEEYFGKENLSKFNIDFIGKYDINRNKSKAHIYITKLDLRTPGETLK